MEAFISEHLKKYPVMQAEDALVLLYQAAEGPGSLPAEFDLAEEIEQEGSALSPEQLLVPYWEAIGGGYCRMNLSVLQVIPAALLARMVLHSQQPRDEALLQKGVHDLKILCDRGVAEFSAERVNKLLKMDSFEAGAVQAVRVHSEAYRSVYSPAYRIVREEYGKYLEVFVRISRLLYRGGEVTVAIDGPSGAGKTTLAALLAQVFNGNHFCTEEFIAAGKFDHARFRMQVLEQVNTGNAFVYEGLNPVKRTAVPPNRLNIVEGPYSLHASLEKFYELKIFLGVSPLVQTRRILGDRGEFGLKQFARELAPRENAYLQSQQTELKCDFVFTAS